MSGTNARIKELERLISYHQDKYYNGQAEISDASFDALWDELSSLDPDNGVLKRVGADYADGFPKARHLAPMGSQEKASDPEAFLKWAQKTGHATYLVQYKLDGASIELQYEKGRYLKAVTRGNGEIGDDISGNAAKMTGVPMDLPVPFSGGIRGEVIMTHEMHDGKHAGKANCRNAANGLMKRKDGQGSEDLAVIVYDAMSSGKQDYFRDERTKLAWLEAMGFQTVPMIECTSPAEVVEYRARIMDLRLDLAYDIDGLVVKGIQIDLDDIRRARPEKQIAFKFSLEEAVSTLRDVEWSESGATYTPIGIIDQVKLAGTSVQRANLCNTNLIREMDLMIGSRVVVTKRGEIIPKIESLVENPQGSRAIPIPRHCSCNTPLIDAGTRLFCPNPLCPKKTLHRIEKWLSVLDVRDFGPVVIRKLHDSGRVSGIPDLYSLEAGELENYERMGPVLAGKILRNLKAKSEISLAAFIAGFDIEGIGETIAEKAVNAGFTTLERMRSASIGELSGIDGFGEITATALIDGLALLKNEMNALLSSGFLKIKPPNTGGALEGLSFCFTGEMNTMKRQDAEALVKSAGGQCKGSVVKGLSYLVANDSSSGSAKNAKARELGIQIIDEAAFIALTGVEQ